MPATRVSVISDFLGFHQGMVCPFGGVTDLGDARGAYHSRGFRITSAGKVEKAGGFSQLGQAFATDSTVEISQIHGMHYWKDTSGGSSIILAGTFGLVRSITKSDAPGTNPYMLRFDTLSQAGPAWTALPSSDPATDAGPGYLFGCFAEFEDRLYYCNGVDWPLRVNTLSELMAYQGNLRYNAMGVHIPTLESCITPYRTKYFGIRSTTSGASALSSAVYLATVVTPYGESPPQAVGTVGSGETDWSDEGTYQIFEIDWTTMWSGSYSPVLEVRFYRIPRAGMVAQYAGSAAVGEETWMDTVEDSGLGVTLPYDSGLPSTFRLLCAFEDRMWGVGGYGRYNRVACSKAGYPDVWPGTFEIPLSAAAGTRQITQLKVVNGSLFLFLDRGILRLMGSSPENYQFTFQNDFVGCIAPRTMFPWQDGIVFLSFDGLYFFNGTELRKLVGDRIGFESLGTVPWNRACGAVNHEYYYLSYRDDSGQKWNHSSDDAYTPLAGEELNRILVINMNNGRVGVIDDWAFSLSTPYEHTEAIVLGGVNGVL